MSVEVEAEDVWAQDIKQNIWNRNFRTKRTIKWTINENVQNLYFSPNLLRLFNQVDGMYGACSTHGINKNDVQNLRGKKWKWEYSETLAARR
jgi:hypothetical protein